MDENRALPQGAGAVTLGSLNGVRIVLVMDASWTSPLVQVQSLSSIVSLVECLLLPNPLGHAQ
jgi:hypothetical protein